MTRILSRLIIASITITLLGSPALAIFNSTMNEFDKSLYLPPEKINESLKKQVNFKFEETKISEILSLLSKVGDFDYILPERLDKQVSVTLNKKKVIEAVDQVMKLSELKYEFRSRALVVSDEKYFGLKVEVYYTKFGRAAELATALNEAVFALLESNADKDLLVKPHAAKDPSNDAIILVGSDSEIAMARNFLAQADIAPKVKLYKPNYLSFSELEELFKHNFSQNETLSLEAFNNETALIKGPENIVWQVHDYFMQRDIPYQAPKISAEFWVAKEYVKETFPYPPNELIKMNPELLKAESLPDFFKFFELKESRNLNPEKGELLNLFDIPFNLKKNLIDEDTLSVFLDEQIISTVNQGEWLLFLVDSNMWWKYPSIKKQFGENLVLLKLVSN